VNAVRDVARGRAVDRDTAEFLDDAWVGWGYYLVDDTDWESNMLLEHLRIYDPPYDVPQIQQVFMPPPFGDGWRLTPYDAVEAVDALVTDDDLVEAIAVALVSCDMRDHESFAAYETVFQAARDEQKRRNALKANR
jgi:hypothetical protein